MAIVRDSVITEYEAVVAGYISDVKRAGQEFERSQQRQARASADATRAIVKNQSEIGASIKGLAAGLVAAFTGRELIGILDNYTKLQNALSIAGLEGDKLTAVQDRLLVSAQRTGAGVNNLAELYGNLSSLQKDLGISSEETLRLTDAVANSIKIAGTSPEQARGAILGLNQALAQGRVQGDEYNQVLDGLRPLLQAAVDNSEKYKGSLNALRRDIIDNGISGAQFYGIIEQGSFLLEGRATKAALTAQLGFKALSDTFTVFFSEAGKGVQISQAIGAGLEGIAKNLDILVPALAAVVVVLGARYVAAGGAVAGINGVIGASLFAVQARAIGAATSMEALAFAGRAAGGSILAAFGGPVGLAITAITVAIGIAVFETDRLTDAQNKNRAALSSANEASGKYETLSRRRAEAIGKERDALEGVIQSEIRLLRIRQQAAASLVRQERAKLDAAKQTASANVAASVRSGPRAVNATRDAENSNLTVQATRLKGAADVLDVINRDIKTLTAGPGASRTFAGVTEKDKAKKGAKGPSAETLAKRAEAARIKDVRDDAAFGREFISARAADLQAQRDLTTSTKLRGEIELQLIDLAKQQTQAELERDGPNGTKRFSAAEVERLKVLNDQIALQRSALAIRTTEQELAQQALEVATAESNNKADLLEGQRSLADTSKERLDIELKLLDLQFEEQKARLDAIIASQASTDAEKQIAAARLAILPQLKAQATEATNRANEGPLAQFRRQAKVTGEDLEKIQVDGIQRLSDGLTDVITKSKSLKSVFKDVANSIIADLVRITVQQAIVAAFGGGSGGGGGDLFGSIAAAFGGGRERGGPVRAGVPYIVGEKRPEVFVPDSNGKIVPSIGQFNRGLPTVNGAAGSSGGVTTIRLMLSGDIDARMVGVANSVAVQVVREASPKIMEGGAMMALKSAARARQNG